MKTTIAIISFLLISHLGSGQVLPDSTLLQDQKELTEQKEELEKVSIVRPAYYRLTKEEYVEMTDRLPNFGMFRDNYIITGIPTNRKINKHTADIKYQFSIRHRITRTTLPLETYLMLTYTQKSFWTVYENSSPFRDNNYNPGLALFTPIIRNNQLRGMSVISLEHESNGRDSTASRSWNYIGISFTYFFNLQLSGQIKIWPGIVDSDGNKDLYDYRGYGMIALNYRTLQDRIKCSLILNPRKKFTSINTQLDFSYRLVKKANVYLFGQWYNGYGEGLLDYNQYRSMVRIGLSLRPDMLVFY